MADLVAISLWQPWASLLFTTSKLDETRHWQPHARHIGTRMAIHAAAKKPPVNPNDAALEALCVRHFGAAWRKTLPLGAFIGTAVLQGVQPTDKLIRLTTPENVTCGDWTPGRYAWRFVAHQQFDPPVPAIGRQGLFRFNPEAAR